MLVLWRGRWQIIEPACFPGCLWSRLKACEHVHSEQDAATRASTLGKQPATLSITRKGKDAMARTLWDSGLHQFKSIVTAEVHVGNSRLSSYAPALLLPELDLVKKCQQSDDALKHQEARQGKRQTCTDQAKTA